MFSVEGQIADNLGFGHTVSITNLVLDRLPSSPRRYANKWALQHSNKILTKTGGDCLRAIPY